MEQINDKSCKMKFITCVMDGVQNGYIKGRNIVIMNQSKAVTYAQMKDMGIAEKYLDTKSAGYTKEELEKLYNKIEQLKAEYTKLLAITPEQLFSMDINDFLKQYLHRYPEEKTRLKEYKLY